MGYDALGGQTKKIRLNLVAKKKANYIEAVIKTFYCK